MKKFIAQFTTSEQYTEDSWKSITPTIEVSEDTTIGEIRRWMDQDKKAPRINEFKVIMLDTPSKPE